MNYPFLESLADTIADVFYVLAPEYVEEQALEVQRGLEKRIDAGYETRYLLIDGETGQLESRRLFETHEEAENASQEPQHGNAIIGTLLVESDS